MRVTHDALHSLSENVEDLKSKVEQMMEQQAEAVEKEEVKENPNDEKIAELQQVSDVLQDVFNNLEAAYDTLSQASAAEEGGE